MILGALIDAGLNPSELTAALAKLDLKGYDVNVARVKKMGLTAVRVEVTTTEDHHHRGLSRILAIISQAELPETVKKQASAVFTRLAEAEAMVHGCDIETVHFHEVGAVDAIVDIVGACWGFHRLGIQRVVCSPFAVGSGTVRCAHGEMPVPAPATALLLRGVPVAESDESGELLTPTGAAILTEWADSFGSMPAMTVRAVGMGAGSREGKHRPNVVRVTLGDAATDPESDQIVVLEANIDDSTAEMLGHAVDRLLNTGALDAWCVPIHMKKSRPGVLLSVLAKPEQADALARIVFEETTTFGIRRHDASRTTLVRRVEAVETKFGPVNVKIGMLDGRVVTVSPEFEDCRAAGIRHKVALRIVMDEARRVWQTR